MEFLFTNNAQTTLAGSISDSATTANLASGGGAKFPDPNPPNQGFYGTFTDAATGLIREIVLVTNRTGDTITMVRAQQGTVGLAWAANDLFAKLWTAGDAEAMLQTGQAQGQQSNYGVDVGVVNAYQVDLDPPLTSPIAGMPIRVKINNTNTGPSTLDPGSGAAPIRTAIGNALVGGELVDNMVVEFFWTGSVYCITDSFPAVPTPKWGLFSSDFYSGVGGIDIENIPATVNDLQVMLDLTAGTAGSTIGLQLYDSVGVLDTGTNYDYVTNVTPLGSSQVTFSNAGVASIQLGDVQHTSGALSLTLTFSGIQRTKTTQCGWVGSQINNAPAFCAISGGGRRVPVGPITGLHFLVSSGVMSGQVDVWTGSE